MLSDGPSCPAGHFAVTVSAQVALVHAFMPLRPVTHYWLGAIGLARVDCDEIRRAAARPETSEQDLREHRVSRPSLIRAAPSFEVRSAWCCAASTSPGLLSALQPGAAADKSEGRRRERHGRRCWVLAGSASEERSQPSVDDRHREPCTSPVGQVRKKLAALGAVARGRRLPHARNARACAQILTVTCTHMWEVRVKHTSATGHNHSRRTP